MKKNRKAILVSLVVLILVGAGLLFWVLDGTEEKERDIQNQADTQSAKEEIPKKHIDTKEVEKPQEELPQEETQEEVTDRKSVV